MGQKSVSTKKVDTMCCIYRRILRMGISVGKCKAAEKKRVENGSNGGGDCDEVTAAASRIIMQKHNEC